MGEGRGEGRAGRKARPAWKRKFHLEYCWVTDANDTISTHVGNKGDHKDLYEYILNQTGYICFYFLRQERRSPRQPFSLPPKKVRNHPNYWTKLQVTGWAVNETLAVCGPQHCELIYARVVEQKNNDINTSAARYARWGGRGRREPKHRANEP